MRLLDIVTAPWAIRPEKLTEMAGVYATHLRGDKIDLKGFQAASFKDPSADRQPYDVIHGVAVIPIDGVLTKRGSWLSSLCGMSSTALIRQDLQAALEDPGVASIVLHIDSPGGTVDGTQELADAIFAARNQKPIVALADGCMCSAAYWAGAAAAKVYITSNTTEVGSIGVVATHTDKSQAQLQAGYKTTEITAGRYKRIASQFAPLSEEGRATIQAQVDHVYSVFVDAVATFRAVSVETVLSSMADGRIFLGSQAIEAGLVDGVSTLDALITSLSSGDPAGRPGAGAAPSAHNPQQEDTMSITREELAAKAPELLQALKDEGKAEATADQVSAIAEAEARGATAERARIQGVLSQDHPGHSALVQTLAFDGKTTADQAASAVLAAEKEKLAAAANKIASEAPKGLPPAGDREPPTTGKPKAEGDALSQGLATAERITRHIQAEAAKGRTLSAVEALQELEGKE